MLFFSIGKPLVVFFYFFFFSRQLQESFVQLPESMASSLKQLYSALDPVDDKPFFPIDFQSFLSYLPALQTLTCFQNVSSSMSFPMLQVIFFFFF
jgi:hypothetical protein